MARGRRDGILIAGGGLAGCLAAMALARFRPDVPFLIVEENERFGGDQYRLFADAELDDDQRDLVSPLISERWPGYYLAFPGFSRKLKTEMSGIGVDELHAEMAAALKPDQYRLGTRVVAVREDSLVLDGGETIKAEGAIDARGAANLSTLDLLYETSLERDYWLKMPHQVDRPVLIDATVDQCGGLRFVRCVPLAEDRLLVADVTVSKRVQPDPEAGPRLDGYLKARGWQAKKVGAERGIARPLPVGGDFSAFWRLGGARVAKLGLRGGFVHPATGSTIADSARNALLLADQRDFSGEALHDLFAAEARRLWAKREFLRGLTAALADADPARRLAIAESLAGLDQGLIARLRADSLGLLDRRRAQKAVRDAGSKR